MVDLTDKQRLVGKFIRKFTSDHSFPPSFREVAWHFGFSLKTASDYICVLEKKGYLTRVHKISRSLVMTEKFNGEI